MRLLHIQGDPWADDRLDISLCEVLGEDVPPYMILSHRWREEEVLFADMADLAIARSKKGYTKLETCCRIALRQGLEYAWDDTCCIDKTSSMELSEAINSMFNYYANSVLCIAYLDDVEDTPKDDTFLNRAVWFTRGWTLQELIAPKELHFYSKGWTHLGTKVTLSRQTSAVARISESVLKDSTELRRICVSEKMSWAAGRTTTRAEDEAYSLMGIFGVNMPPLYGEGRVNAFRRLQLEILQTTSDHTLFAWDSRETNGGMLAPSVSHFSRGSEYEPTEYGPAIFKEFQSEETQVVIKAEESVNRYTGYVPQVGVHKPDFNMTNSGLHIQLLMELLPTRIWGELWFAFLGCRTKVKHQMVAIILQKSPRSRFLSFNRVVFDGQTIFHFAGSAWESRFLPITRYNPIWISEFKLQDSENLPIATLPSTTKRIHFEFGIRARNPVSQIYYSTSSSSIAKIHPKEVKHVQLTPGPSPPPENFTNSSKLLQHVIKGSIPATGFSHEIITFRGKKHFDIAFGVLNNSIWFQIASADENTAERAKGWISKSGYDDLYQSFEFPLGRNWQRKKNGIMLLEGFEKTTSISKKENSARCDVDVVIEKLGEDEVLLRCYVVSSGEWKEMREVTAHNMPF